MLSLVMTPHPLVAAAASGELPAWAVAGPNRREHMARVADLMSAWGDQRGLTEAEQARWRAAANLHDSLRDAPAAELRPLLAGAAESLPDALLHGPAAAKRLRGSGVDDEELLAAVAFHTTGDPTFGTLGRALYAADFLEPGRSFMDERRHELRALAEEDLDSVVLAVVRERIRHQAERGGSPHPRTLRFLSVLEGELRA